jgi:hypothetical protein
LTGLNAIAATRLMAFFGDNFPLKWLSCSRTSFLGGAMSKRQRTLALEIFRGTPVKETLQRVRQNSRIEANWLLILEKLKLLLQICLKILAKNQGCTQVIHTNLWRRILDNLLKSGVNCGRGVVHPKKEVLPSQHVG